MNLRAYAKALGGRVAGAQSILAPGPGHSPADRSLSVLFSTNTPPGKDGFIVHSYAGDDPIQCRDYVRQRLGLGDWKASPEWPSSASSSPPPQSSPSAITDAEQARRVARALAIWNSASDPRGTVVEVYLRSRAVGLEDTITGQVIRFRPALSYAGSRCSGMVCLMRDVRTDEPCGIQRTILKADGTKIDRLMLGRAKGAAIKLDADEHVTTGLTVGEGMETCLAARLAGFRPTWALGSAGGIQNFPVLQGIEALTILGETDDSGANERASDQCGQRWLVADAEVNLVTPTTRGDFADVWKELAS
ncbi:DUF7146 domain-containing protein [Terrihabitans sp. B22-R8]|uniref:DUF7146 domain-containing protein n=1 Tax=Terrihabitans sp. B22-R8 TaxID=3425128 RepID=UPI00403D1679